MYRVAIGSQSYVVALFSLCFPVCQQNKTINSNIIDNTTLKKNYPAQVFNPAVISQITTIGHTTTMNTNTITDSIFLTHSQVSREELQSFIDRLKYSVAVFTVFQLLSLLNLENGAFLSSGKHCLLIGDKGFSITSFPLQFAVPNF